MIFLDSEMTGSAIDRLIHHETLINIDEKSYRKASQAPNKIDKKSQ